jgi:hypothetical protein
MSSNDVIVRLRAIGQAAFTSAMDEAARSVGHVGTQAKKSSGATDSMGGAASKAAPKWKRFAGGLAAAAGGAAALYAAKRGIQTSITSTMDLAKSTLALERQTGLSAESASAWGSVLKARGVDSKQFGVGMTKLSKTMVKASTDSKTFSDTFGKLGVSQDAVRKGDVNGVIMQSADAFAAMKNPAEKAALAQTLFGKQAQNLIPLMSSGSAGIKEQLGWAKKYGATLGGKSTQSAADFIKRQREMSIAMEGLKVSAGTALLPVITSLSTMLLQLTQTLQPLLRNATLLKVVIGALTIGFIAYKVAVIASTIASMGMVAVWALIPLAIIAIGAALVYAYKKVAWFRNAVNAAFAFIKKNWRVLLGFLTLGMSEVVIRLVQNWAQIRAGFRTLIATAKTIYRAVTGTFTAMWGALRRGADSVISFFKNLGGKIVHGIVEGIKSAPGAILSALKSLLPGGKAGRLISKAIPGLALGGVVRTAGAALVGERGPEVVTLDRGARVSPLPAPSIAPILSGGFGGGDIRVPVYLDGRVLTEVVANRTADRRARR